MNAEIIAIGSELLLGQIANTNAQFLSKELANIGVNVYYHGVVGDNKQRLLETIQFAQKRSNLIIFTGGLGPTKDDLTKETIAEAVNRSLVSDDEAVRRIEGYFQRRNRQMTENNLKQALVISGSKVLPNDNGMAPGMAFEVDKINYLLLPGPPSEMKPMFVNYGIPFLFSKLENNTKISSRVLNFFDIGESQLETELMDLIDSQTNPTIAPLAKEGEVTIRLTVKHEDLNQGYKLLDELEKKILTRVGSYFYGYDDTSLLLEVIQILENKDLTIASAESLTGGSFSKLLTSKDGSSSYFKGGIVSYSNEAKQTLLNVPKELIDTYGSVSEQCAKSMAENIRKLLNTDVGISFTGVAGPNDLEGKPVGTVLIGLSVVGEPTMVFSLKLAGTREQIQNRTVKHGLHCLLKHFQKGGKKE